MIRVGGHVPHVQFPSGLELGAGKEEDLQRRDSTLPIPPAMAAICARVHDAGGPGLSERTVGGVIYMNRPAAGSIGTPPAAPDGATWSMGPRPKAALIDLRDIHLNLHQTSTSRRRIPPLYDPWDVWGVGRLCDSNRSKRFPITVSSQTFDLARRRVDQLPEVVGDGLGYPARAHRRPLPYSETAQSEGAVHNKCCPGLCS